MSNKLYMRAGTYAGPEEKASRSSTDNLETVLVFDTETFTDFGQHLRVGGYQIKDTVNNVVLDAGFILGDLTEDDERTVRTYAANYGQAMAEVAATGNKEAYQPTLDYHATEPMRCLTHDEFVDLLYSHLRSGYGVCGHNLPFDIGAIATCWWGHDNSEQGKGFHFTLCNCADQQTEIITDKKKRVVQKTCARHPPILTRTLGAKKTVLSVKGWKDHGPMCDTATMGRALKGAGPSALITLGRNFGCKILKQGGEVSHGEPITSDYLKYLSTDVLASMDLLEAQIREHAKHGIRRPLSNLWSEASVGKAYFDMLGIKPGIRDRPITVDGDDTLHNERIMSITQNTYKGGRSEVRYRLKAARCAWVDFRSDYPACNALCQLQDMLLAESYRLEEGPEFTAKVQGILEAVTIDRLRWKQNWPSLRKFVKVRLNGDLIPTRWDAVIDGKKEKPFGMVAVTGAEVWMTLADAISSKLITGRVPEIIEAFEIHPSGNRIPTSKMILMGMDEIDLDKVDLFTAVIDLRAKVKKILRKMKEDGKSDTPEYDELNSYQLVLKLISNATAYGALAETRASKVPGKKDAPGPYYAPFIASLITGASRLLLAMAECLARDFGNEICGRPIGYAVMDTDSCFFVCENEDDYTSGRFAKAITKVTDWFKNICPYDRSVDPSMFTRDDDDDGSLWVFGVSCKRYAVFRKVIVDGKTTVKLMKVSAHATGMYRFDDVLPLPKNVNPPAVEPQSPIDDMQDDDDDWVEENDEVLDLPDLSGLRDKEKRNRMKWRPYQHLMWVSAINHSLGREQQSYEKSLRLPCTIPMEDWSQNTARMMEVVSTPDKLLMYQSLGIRPYSFFLTLKSVENSTLRLATHFAPTEAEMKLIGFWDVKTGRHIEGDAATAYMMPLFRTFYKYFARPETKAWAPNASRQSHAIGWLDRPSIKVTEIVERNRKGQRLRVEAEDDLFAELV